MTAATCLYRAQVVCHEVTRR